MSIAPLWLLAILIAALFGVRLFDLRRERHADEAFSALAREAKMNFSPLDRFDLAVRLRASPDWRGRTTGLVIRDVLYAARGDERRFIATAVRRASPDDVPVARVIACVERVSDGSFYEHASSCSAGNHATIEEYRAVLDAWPGAADRRAIPRE